MAAVVPNMQVVCPLERLKPWKDQPRTETDPKSLDELADSIRQHGLIEPIVVRVVGEDLYEIICGERRWRAAQRAGLHEVPIIVRELDDDTAFEMAVSENVSRESLSLADLATACERYRLKGLSGVQIAKLFGCSESTVSGALAVSWNLPPQVIQLNREGALTNGHLRALRNVTDPKRAVDLAKRAVKEQLPVAELAREVLRASAAPKQQRRKAAGIRDLELRFERKFGMRCTIASGKKERVTVTLLGNLDQLDRLVEITDI